MLRMNSMSCADILGFVARRLVIVVVGSWSSGFGLFVSWAVVWKCFELTLLLGEG